MSCVCEAIDVGPICEAIRELYRQRCVNLKSRIMIVNRLVSTLAAAEGCHAGMTEAERGAYFEAARKRIEAVEGEVGTETDSYHALILATLPAVHAFDDAVRAYEKAMEARAKELPVYAWLCLPEQKGVGALSLAKIVGEAGDLANYPNPGKLWRRMGCAPVTAHGKTLMPATWRATKPGLSAAEWEETGYSPRRRSVMYVISEGLVKQNGPGPYRRRYDRKKAEAAANHDDWKPLRCHRHGMLLMGKLLLKNLWCEWTGEDPTRDVFTHGLYE